jgi:transposase InsO family protein|tara:strand:+ start:368 stop:1228 length:861 start_codon:yes stop_codon:yes gene_type:complete
MNYDLVQECQGRFSVDRMCKALDVSRSGYYAWKDRPPSKRERENRELAFHIKAIHRETDATYGTPRVTAELNEAGMPCGKNRIARIKREMNLRAVGAPRKFRCTTKAASDAVVSPDLIGRVFEAEEPNPKWVSDITYIPVGDNYAYLAVVMDLFSRKIVSWSLRATMTTELILGAVRKAQENRRPTTPLIFHSDRGSQYTSEIFRRALAENGMKSSMGHTGDCFDNAVAESFFSTLKKERVNRETYATLQQARRRIDSFIKFYNQRRRHSTLGQMCPDAYEERNLT